MSMIDGMLNRCGQLVRPAGAAAALVAVVAAMAIGGCRRDGARIDPANVPQPFTWLLPKSIEIHSFTKTRTTFEVAGEVVRGIRVHIQAKDVTGAPVKAFGDFRIEAYSFRANHPDPKGQLLEFWPIPLHDLEENLKYWDSFSLTYEFPLQWENPPAAGRKFILVAVFSSPYTKRLFDQRKLISGE